MKLLRTKNVEITPCDVIISYYLEESLSLGTLKNNNFIYNPVEVYTISQPRIKIHSEYYVKNYFYDEIHIMTCSIRSSLMMKHEEINPQASKKMPVSRSHLHGVHCLGMNLQSEGRN